ncbi:MAG: low temperature requirement protein A [Actinomycetota bacterium]|nr:low temperature requirement protein A [Actinomycetota bacterium]
MAGEQTLIEAAEAADETGHASDSEERVGPLELFFDLVFVFAITQVTQFIANDPTWEGLARALMILAVVWWAWAAYAWLTNTLDTEDDRVRLVMFAAMGAMFVVSLSIPNAFSDDALLFALAYFVVRAAHILLYGYAANDTGVQQATKRLAPSVIIATALLVAASFLDGVPQALLWLAAIAIDYAGPVIAGMEGWTLHPGHFAERHGLIVIIAFGESIVATGLGAEGIELGPEVVLAALFGIVIAAALWWLYFDVVAIVAERRLHEARGLAQIRMARDSYSFIHLLMIAGIVLMALGAKKTIAAVDEPLKLVPAVALCGGVALYLLGHIAFRLRNVGTLNRQRLVVAAIAAALIPVAVELDALVTVGLLAALCASLIAYEAIHFREARQRVRAASHPE